MNTVNRLLSAVRSFPGSFSNPYVHPASFHTSLRGVEVESSIWPKQTRSPRMLSATWEKRTYTTEWKKKLCVGIFSLKFWLPIWKSDFWSTLKNVNPSTAQTSVVCRDLSGNTGCSDRLFMVRRGFCQGRQTWREEAWSSRVRCSYQTFGRDATEDSHETRVSSPWQHSASKLARERYAGDNLEPQLAPICFWAFSKLCVQGQLFSQDNTLLLIDSSCLLVMFWFKAELECAGISHKI